MRYANYMIWENCDQYPDVVTGNLVPLHRRA